MTLFFVQQCKQLEGRGLLVINANMRYIYIFSNFVSFMLGNDNNNDNGSDLRLNFKHAY